MHCSIMYSYTACMTICQFQYALFNNVQTYTYILSMCGKYGKLCGKCGKCGKLNSIMFMQ